MAHRVGTNHIGHMLVMAQEMADHAHGHTEQMIEWRGKTYVTDQFLLRAANLAAHAAQELTDEAFLVDGFPG